MALLVLALAGCGVASSSAPTAPSLTPEQTYNQEAVNVVNKYEFYLRTLHVTPTNFLSTTPKQLHAEGVAIADLKAVHPPRDMASLHARLIAALRFDRALTQRGIDQFQRGDRRGLLLTLAAISRGLVRFDRVGAAIYRKAQHSKS